MLGLQREFKGDNTQLITAFSNFLESCLLMDGNQPKYLVPRELGSLGFFLPRRFSHCIPISLSVRLMPRRAEDAEEALWQRVE